MAEFLGVAVFVAIGAGADCSVVLSTDPNVASTHKGVSITFNTSSHHSTRLFQEFLSANLGWAIGEISSYAPHKPSAHPRFFTGLALGVWITLGISGGHVNPAVCTLFLILCTPSTTNPILSVR